MARAGDDRSRPKPEEQAVPGLLGFHAGMSKPDDKRFGVPVEDLVFVYIGYVRPIVEYMHVLCGMVV